MLKRLRHRKKRLWRNIEEEVMTHSFHLIYITPQKRSLLMRKRAVITTLTEGKNHLFLSPAKESTWFHSMNIRRKNSKSQLDTTFWIFPHFFQYWLSNNSGPAGRMADLPVLKKCGKIQNVASSFGFEIFSPEIHTLKFQNCDSCDDFFTTSGVQSSVLFRGGKQNEFELMLMRPPSPAGEWYEGRSNSSPD